MVKILKMVVDASNRAKLKDGLATIIAEWENIDGMTGDDASKLTMRMTPEIVLKSLEITDEDVNFMGFSSVGLARLMICQVRLFRPGSSSFS